MFHSISAYNNAGFDSGPTAWSDITRIIVNAVAMLLIVMGGLAGGSPATGFRRGRRRPSLHTRLVLRTTLLLIAFGTLGLVTEWLNRGEVFIGMAWPERWMTALFESVTARTAGFTTVPFSLENITDSGTLLLMALMFIGAVPAGPAAGSRPQPSRHCGDDLLTLLGSDSVVIRNR